MVEEKEPLKFSRYFTENLHKENKTPYDSVKWSSGKTDITDENGKVVFVQENVESPEDWSGLARTVVASKYFYGGKAAPGKENSVRQIVSRVSETLGIWAIEQSYYASPEEAKAFEEEIAYLVLNQYVSFNSPVWFNVGVGRYVKPDAEKEQRHSFIIYANENATLLPLGQEYEWPQSSACFIQSVKDTMEDIMDLSKKEALLFKYGSGTGTDLSTLRSSREKLSGGGEPSGPLAYLGFYDKVAGIVKSGGKTRRAAKMNSLKCTHPDILEFITAKAREQDKLEMLVAAGVCEEEAKATVAYQNVNFSVRATDEFMRAAERNGEWQTIPVHNKEMADKMPKYKAKELLSLIAKGTHRCGEPGMQFDDTINRWHTCSNSGRINASNPCSEYMFLDDSSCNLASLRLTKFLREDRTYDAEKHEMAARITARAQDVLIDRSSYPTKEIAENSHKFRPLGTGYADLGALVMALGLPYDSDEGRAVAGAITALHTGAVYLESTFMAEQKGAFAEFEKNKEPMLKVIDMHREALKKIDRAKIPKGLENILNRAEKIWEEVAERGRKYGFRNAQATNLAPTGTIGFMMDCDTTGIEPDIGLVKYKKLAGGGTLKLVNMSVKPTLQRLGYSESDIEKIVKHIDEKETIEGAPGIRDEHLPIFDCALKPKKGSRSIHYMGHLKMLAAVQPFLSGAISKTVNMPKESTLEDIERTYMEAWKMELKAVAIYRDGSRKDQVVSTYKSQVQEHKPIRKKLPRTRNSITHKFDIAGHEGYLTVGLYKDGTPGELFITMNKEGSTIGGLMDSLGTAVSLCLQYGAPISSLCTKFKNQKFEPNGLVREGDYGIRVATSIVDYIFTWLEKRFPEEKTEEQKNTEKIAREMLAEKPKSAEAGKSEEEKGGFCPVCGAQMIKKGGCMEICPTCYHPDTRGCGE